MPSLTGISQITCYQSGANLLLPNSADRSGLTNGIAYSYDSDTQTFSFNGTNEKTDANWLVFNRTELTFDGVKIGATYYFSHTLPANMYAQITYKDSNNSNHALVYLAGNASKNASVSFTIPNDFASLNNFQIGVSRTLGAIDDTAVFMVSAVASADYEAYEAPTLYTASLGRTIYGGEVDVVKGTGTKSYDVIRLDSLPFIKNNNQTNPNGTYFSLDGVVVPFIGWGYGYGGRDTAMSNVLNKGSISATGSSEPNNTFWWNNASTGWRVIWGDPNGGSSLEDFMAFLTANDVVVGGTLQNTEAFTFDPVPIDSLYGDNTMWSDNGDIEVTYRRDIALALAQ